MANSTLDLNRILSNIQDLKQAQPRLYESVVEIAKNLNSLGEEVKNIQIPTTTGTSELDLTGFSDGSILFINPAETLNQNHANFHITPGTYQLGVGTDAPDATAQVQINSTTRGFLAPRMTSTQRDAISSPAEGLLIYNTTLHEYQEFDGTDWKTLYSSGGTGGWTDDGVIVRLTTSTDRVSIGHNTGEACAVLSLISTTKGFLLPVMTAVERAAITSPVQGLLVWDSVNKAIYHHDGTNWIKQVSGQDAAGWTFNDDPFVPEVVLTNTASRVSLGAQAGTNAARLLVANPSGVNEAIRLIGTSTGITFGTSGTSTAYMSILGSSSGINVKGTAGAGLFVNASGQVGIGNTSPHSAAILDISGVALGFRLPSMTQSQMNGLTGVAGLSIYNTTVNKICYYNGSSWVPIESAASGAGWIYQDNGGPNQVILYDTLCHVGIGVTANNARLEISKSSWQTSAYQVECNGSSGGIGFRNITTILGSVAYGATVVSLMNQAQSAAQGIHILQSNGNVGVGTGSPLFKLDVQGTGRFTQVLQLDVQGNAPNQAIHAGRFVNTGAGLSGGGNLASDRTINIDTSYSFSWSGLHTFSNITKFNNSIEFYSGGTRQGVISAASGIIGISNNAATGYIWIRSTGVINFSGKDISYGPADSAGAGYRTVRVPN